MELSNASDSRSISELRLRASPVTWNSKKFYGAVLLDHAAVGYFLFLLASLPFC